MSKRGRPGWGYAALAAIVFPLVGPAGPVALTALPLAVMGLFALGPGGVFYVLFLAAWWLPAAYTLLGPPLLLAGCGYGIAATLTGRPRLWLAVLAAEIAVAGWFGAMALMPGGVEAIAPSYMPMWQGMRQNPMSIVGVVLSTVGCWWLLRRLTRARPDPTPSVDARMGGGEKATATLAVLAGALLCVAVLRLISNSPEVAWKDCLDNGFDDRMRGCPVIAGAADQTIERRALASYRLAGALENGGDLSGALAAFSEAARLDPNMAGAYAGRALIRARAGEHGLVIPDVDEALRLDPTIGHASRLLRARGQAHLATGRPDLAITDHTEEFRLTPRYADGLFNRARAHLARGDAESALADAEAGIRLEVSHPRGYIVRGLARVQAGETDSALADFDEAIRKGPNLALTLPAYLGRARILEARGDRKGAFADFEKALSVVPSDPEAGAGRDRLRANLPASPPVPR